MDHEENFEPDVEVDETTFVKRTLAPCELSTSDKKAGRNTVWEQWCGLVQRGCPQTLVLVKLNPAITVPRAPGPGAMRKVDWQPVAEKWLLDRRVIFHSDSAKHHRLKVAGVPHDAVVHPKKRVMKAGKYVWKNPTYVKMSTHQLPDGRKVKKKAVHKSLTVPGSTPEKNHNRKASGSLLSAQMNTGTGRTICG